MSQMSREEERRALDLEASSCHYRSFIGRPQFYDLMGAYQFNLLTFLGLRETNTVLDIGCGSLRAGKLLITYLLPGRYYGIEPEEWLVKESIQREIGQDLVDLKQPRFSHDRSFNLSVFGIKFDYLLACSIFSHASQTQIRRCFREARQVMHTSSIFACTYHKGDSNYKGEEWVYPDVVGYETDFFAKMAADEGLRAQEIQWNAPPGQRWMLIVRSDYEGQALSFDDCLPVLLAERDYYRKRVAEIESHPYVRVGIAIKKLLKLWRG